MTALVMNVNIVQWMNGNQKKLKNSKMHFFVPRSLDIYSKCLMLLDFVHRISDIPE